MRTQKEILKQMQEARESIRYGIKSKSYQVALFNQIEFRTLRWVLGGNFINEGEAKI